MRRLVAIVVTLFALWIVIVFALGFVFANRAGNRVASRLGESLQATWTLGDASLGLVGGSLDLEKLALRRDDVIGKLALDVAEVHCDLPPLGLALVDRTCGPLEIEGVKLEVSTTALFKIKKPKRRPFRADRVVIDNAELVFLASAFMPDLGQVRIAIEHAEAGPTTFQTPLSFLFALQELTAVFDLPAGIKIRMRYEGGKVTAQGSIFGSTPVTLPVALPKLTSADDAQAEIAKLVRWAKDLAEELVKQKAEDWLRRKLPDL